MIASSVEIALSRFSYRPLIAVIPERDRRALDWNDFGRRYFLHLLLRTVEGSPVLLNLRMMFEGEAQSSAVIEQLLQQRGEGFLIDGIDLPYVSLLPQLDGYREIIEVLGFDVGISALRKLGDAVVARSEGVDKQRLRLAETEDFHLGILRSPDAYVALRRGARYFRRTPPREIKELSTSFTLTASLPSADNLYELEFDFERDPVFQDRISILIGRNGVGKTKILKALVDGLTDKSATSDLSIVQHLTIEPTVAPARVLVFSSVPTDPFPRAIGAWRGIDYEYFPVNSSETDYQDSLLMALIACIRDNGSHSFGPNRDQSRLDVVRSTLESLNLWKPLHVPLRPLKPNEDGVPLTLNLEGKRYFRCINPWGSWWV